VRLIPTVNAHAQAHWEGHAYYERVAPCFASIEEAEDVVQVASEAKGLFECLPPQESERML